MLICFDVDGTLFEDGKPMEANVTLMKLLAKRHKVFMWSGNGWQYTYEKAKILGVLDLIQGVANKYGTFRPDISFDDHELDLGKVNIQV